MTDDAIAAATGIGDSTFHRWAKSGTLPQLDKLLDFCHGLDIPVAAALAALGVAGRPMPTEPDLDPDLQRLGRIVRSPSLSEADKAYIRRTLQMLISIYGRTAGDRVSS